MNENNNTPVMLEEEESAFDFMQLWTLFKSHWKWFPVSIIVCVLIAFVYLWFTPTTLSVSGKMEIIDKSKSSGMSAGLAMLNSLPLGLGSSLGGSASIGIESEKEILTSTSLVRDVVKDLDLYTEYRLSRWGKKTLLYQNNPVTVTLDAAHVAWLDAELPLNFHQIKLTISKGSNGYEVAPTLVEGNVETDLPVQTFAQLPATIQTESGTLTLTENKLPKKQAKAYAGSYTLEVTITPPTTAAGSFIGRMTAEPPSKKVMNILTLSLQDENLMRGLDFIKQLVATYNQRANDEKNEEARKTDEFVRERLAMVDAELSSSDAAWENSKKNFQITTPEVDAQEALAKKSEYEAQLVAIGTQLQLHDYLSDYINNPANLYELIPVGLNATMGSGSDAGSSASDGGAANSSLIARHNALVSQRKDLLKSVSEMSPQVQRLTESIRELHPDIQLAMKRQRESIVMQKRTLEREFGKYSGRIGSAPQMERVLTEIGRQREIKQGVYLVMLQKREETAMELANTTDKGRLIDDVKVDGGSVKPQRKSVLLIAFFLGALLPMGILYLLQMFKQKVDTRAELEAAAKLPILAEIPHATSDEAIRDLRTNLLLNLKDGQKAILVVSEHDGDGKTFVAQHLVDSLKVIGKTAAYVGADYRKISKPGAHAADVLASSDFAAQIDAAKANNDYVVIDTPALSSYSDAYQVAQFADVTLYVVKAGQTQKSALQALYTNPHLPNPLIVFNV